MHVDPDGTASKPTRAAYTSRTNPTVPFHFGSSSAPLYGVFHAAGEPRRRRAALVLAPWGWEALRAHRTLHSLAERLARHGHDVLRFDYSCSGDSAGDQHDVSATRWLQDTEEALDEVLAMSGAFHVTVVGLRLGGLLAMSLAARRPREVDRLVLWEAARSGAEFVQWLDHAPHNEKGAFPVTPTFQTEILEFSGHDLSTFRGRVLSIASEPLGLSVPQAASFEEAAPPPGSPVCWIEDRDHGAGAVPVDQLNRIVRWLDG